jgi:hypothetical protein
MTPGQTPNVLTLAVASLLNLELQLDLPEHFPVGRVETRGILHKHALHVEARRGDGVDVPPVELLLRAHRLHAQIADVREIRMLQGLRRIKQREGSARSTKMMRGPH